MYMYIHVYIFIFSEHFCIFSQEAFEKFFGHEQISTVGYIEKDGNPGLTREDERVVIDDRIEANVTVHVACSNWLVLACYLK